MSSCLLVILAAIDADLLSDPTDQFGIFYSFMLIKSYSVFFFVQLFHSQQLI